MFALNYGGHEPTNQPEPEQQQPDLAAQLEQERKAREALEQQVKDLRHHSIRSTETANQQINLLRCHLNEQLRPQAQSTTPAPQSDDWMSMLTGGSSNTPAPATQGERLMTPSEVRRMIQEEDQRKAQAHYQETQKVEELNSRFMAEYPDLAKNQAAVKLIQNQFLAVSNLRPDLPAESRYRLAVDNVQQEMLPLLGTHTVPKDPPKEKPKANPYMPSIFAPPPGQASLDTRLGQGAVDSSSLEDKYARRQKEIAQWNKDRAKLQGR
jgi:hypothetical protein